MRAFPVQLPSGIRYWTVVDDELEVVEEADRFLRELRLARGRAETTTKAYAEAVVLFLAWCAPTKREWRTAARDMGLFMLWLKWAPGNGGQRRVVVPGPGTKPVRGESRINKVLTAVRMFLAHAVVNKAAPAWVLEQIYEVADDRDLPQEARGESGAMRYRMRARHRLQEPETAIDRAGDDEIVAMFLQCRSARDRLILLLLSRVGLRPGQVAGLRRCDPHLLMDSRSLRCDVEGAHVHVIRRENENRAWSKSKKSWAMPVDFLVVQAFDQYVLERHECLGAGGSDFLLVNLFRPPYGGPMTTDAIGELCESLSRRAGLGRMIGPRMCRHAMASNVADAGGKLDEVVEVAGERVTKMLPFDEAKIFPYAYRHTYAQRHADAGIPVDALRALMDHRQLDTTQRYYRVSEKRQREAVERVTAVQFDRHGKRVWRQVKAVLDSEHARRAIGETQVPYGTCTEPSNVAVGGQDCPVRFRCVGCSHFRTDVSYLPDLEAYLADLLRNRERLAAFTDADDWARSEAMPSDDEITRVRRLVKRVREELDDLTDEDRAQIQQAITVVCRTRAGVVSLGMPKVRQPLPDLRPREDRMTSGMIEGKRADSARRRDRVIKALDAALQAGDDITVSGLARAARVDRSFLYRHRDLLERVHTAASTPVAEGRLAAVSRTSLQTDLANALERNTRLTARVRQLEKRLSEQLGAQAWRESGLGASPDIDQLQRRAVMLEQELVEKRGVLEERTEELEAARAANRELTRALNQPHSGRS